MKKGKDSRGDFAAVLDRIELVEQLMSATAEHDQWVWAVNRTLLCRAAGPRAEPGGPCAFDRWYRVASQHPLLRDVPALKAAAAEHAAVHRILEQLAESAGKPIDPARYDRFLEARHGFKEHTRQLEQSLWTAACQADALTGLRNRQGMLAELREEQQRSIREMRPCVIAMMDVDHFKTVNDRYGHQVGDAILAEISTSVAERLRPYDRIYRYGGEEFLICLPDTAREQARQIIERLRFEIARRPLRTKGRLVPVTASFGLAYLDPERPVESSIDRADQALYRAKREGRNRVRMEALGAGGGWAASPAS